MQPSTATVRNGALLLIVPLSLALHRFGLVAPVWVFLCGLVAIAVLADWMRRATEQVAAHAGSAIGSLLNVSFGNAAELALALFVLARAQTQVVQAQITGSIIGTALLFLGIAILAGGVRRPRQTFSKAQVGLLSTLLLLLTVAILLPAFFNMTERLTSPGANLSLLDEQLSLCVSVVLLALYGAHLVYMLVTHKIVFAQSPVEDAGPKWTLPLGLAVMVGATIGIALESELLSSRLAETASGLGLSPIFMGVVALALVGTAADLFAAVAFARADKMDLVLGLCIGSAIQIALVVAPILVLASWVLGRPMNLVFDSPLDLFAIASAALVARAIVEDGETNWYEGFILIGVYVLLALAFYFQS